MIFFNPNDTRQNTFEKDVELLKADLTKAVSVSVQWHQITSVHTTTTSTFFQEIADLTGKFKNVGFLRKSFWNLVTSSGGNSGVRLDCAKISEGLGCLWKLTCYSNGKQLNTDRHDSESLNRHQTGSNRSDEYRDAT